MTKQFVVYRRLSKVKVGGASYGMDAQSFDIQNYLDGVPDHEVIGEFGEFYSGGKGYELRPEFNKALKMCEETGATLVVSKVDRASRNVRSLATIMEKVDLVVATQVGADELTLHILASVAASEWRTISARTKAGLAAAKRAGKKLGGYRPRTSGEMNPRKAASIARAVELAPTIDLYRNKHGMTLVQTAEALNSAGVFNAHGSRFTASGVHSYIKHAKNNQRTEA